MRRLTRCQTTDTRYAVSGNLAATPASAQTSSATSALVGPHVALRITAIAVAQTLKNTVVVGILQQEIASMTRAVYAVLIQIALDTVDTERNERKVRKWEVIEHGKQQDEETTTRQSIEPKKS